MSDDRPRAALRDASFSRTHRQSLSKSLGYLPVYHVIGEDGFTGRCGILLDPDTEQLAEVCFSRCQRNGCRQHWPKGNA